jgi:hypothetical protein
VRWPPRPRPPGCPIPWRRAEPTSSGAEVKVRTTYTTVWVTDEFLEWTGGASLRLPSPPGSGLGASGSGSPVRTQSVEVQGSHRFLAIPSRACRILGPRWARSDSPLVSLRLLPSTSPTVSAPTSSVDFGAESCGPFARCLRFAAVVAHEPRKTRYRPAG